MTEPLVVSDTLAGAEEAFEQAYAAGWTDGLPIMPPTRQSVDRMIAAGGRPPDEVLAMLPPTGAEATVELLATCAVMAGCRPDYFPTVIAALEAVTAPEYGLYIVNTTTNPVAPMLIVNGPVRHALELNGSYGVLGPGHRANATIGRAISLAMINVAGRVPGSVCKATHAQPGRFTMCIAEREEASPWEPYHVERGLAPGSSAVTAVAPTGTINVLDMTSSTADDLLTILASSMKIPGSVNLYPFWGLAPMLLILCPDHARLLAGEGLSKQDVKRELFRRTRDIPLDSLVEPVRRDFVEKGNTIAGRYVSVAARPEQFDIVVAGGSSGHHSVFLPTFGDSWPVTREIPRPGAA